MTWAIWLAAPIVATTLAALWAWVRGALARRAARPPTTEQSVAEHAAYLSALTIAARGEFRIEPEPDPRD